MTRRTELSDFLRSRRARLSPPDVGMPEAGRRRTPGLRREEVAVLAGVGVSWYTWLEQGRDIKVSGEVLDAVARALRLDQAEREHLYLLAGLNPPRRPPAPAVPTSPELWRVLEAWAPRPAYIRDRHWNLVAVNDQARAVFGYDETDRNCLVAYFMSARYRRADAAWAQNAPVVVARFRAEAARYPDDPEFGRIAAGLAAASPEFAGLWARHDVSAGTRAVKTVLHPEHGTLTYEALSLPLDELPGYHLELFNPLPASLVVAHPG
ncbi:helix-turn-helix transcriptional regulator [Nonomuraea typhae]|uniref:helix-turn-helix transcriptional regulator n=1 Tax=Nonomuraea typhae TaxID=2603600 RepID=UPI0012F7DA4E|nr:helix-turn-helix transcriptional regulator [Nonomuraea typhae]